MPWDKCCTPCIYQSVWYILSSNKCVQATKHWLVPKICARCLAHLLEKGDMQNRQGPCPPGIELILNEHGTCLRSHKFK